MGRKAKIPSKVKLKVVEDYLAGKITVIKTATELGVNKNTIRAWIRIYKTFGGDLGQIRSNASSYATSFSERAYEANRMAFNMDTEEDVRAMAERVSRMNRYYGINLKNIATDRAPTVEFRYFNGSLNPKQIQANIKLAAGIINASEKSRWRDTEDENYKKRGQILKNSTTSSGTRTKEKMIELLDIAFARKKDKDMILNVLKKNQWR